MITCPECGGLNPITSKICGNCGKVLNENAESIDDKIKRKEDERKADLAKAKNIYAEDIVLFVVSLLCWFFIPFLFLKFVVAAGLFFMAESSNHKKSIFLILVRIVCLFQMIGFLLILIFGDSGTMAIISKLLRYSKVYFK